MPADIASRHHVIDWPRVPGRLPLTEEAVRRTIGIADPAVRNLWITQSYADLAHRLLDLLGTDQTWCTFAIWASNTAGVTIRGEELPHIVATVLPEVEDHLDATLAIVAANTSWLRRLGVARPVDRSHLEHVVTQAIGQVSQFIANGNTLVFAELAPLFVRFVRAVEADGVPDDGHDGDAIDRWLDELAIPTLADAHLVRTAFRQYAAAAATSDPKQRSQHVLTANVAAVLHEQQRLQDDIEAALDAGIVDLGAVLDRLLPRAVPRRVRARIDRDVHDRAGAHIEPVWRRVTTHLLMTLIVPGAVLRLDRDVPSLADGERFPPSLRDLALPELRELLEQWDATGGTGHGSGAHDWSDLRQRMTYIVNLFRSRQQHLTLTVPPFSTRQLAWMVRGEVPPIH
jgi:hypothetical protein